MRNMKSLDVIVRESCLKTTRSLHVSTMKPYSRTNSKSFGGAAAAITENRLSHRHHHNLSHLRERTVPVRDPLYFLSQGQLGKGLKPITPYFPPSRTFAPSNRSNYLSVDGGHSHISRDTIVTSKSSPVEEAERMNQLHQAKNIWKKAEAICFDVDSTVIQDEAIDELAKFCGKGSEVEQLTQEAMKGGMDFREALALRLDLIRPNLAQLRNYIFGTKQRLSPYVKELIHELHKRGKEVFLISGGFRSIILPLAQELHIPSANVYANKLKFYHDGEYAGFDENQLTSRTGGKGAVIRNLKEKHGFETVVMIGDGITDWEASPPADLFIGFGGNAYRQEVKSRAKWYVTDFRDLINELKD